MFLRSYSKVEEAIAYLSYEFYYRKIGSVIDKDNVSKR